MTGSPKFTLSQADLLQIAKGAALAAAGAILTYFASEVLPQLDESSAIGGGLAALLSVLLNVLRKWLADTRHAA